MGQSDVSPIVPGSMQLEGVTLGQPARVGNTWVWHDWRIPHGQVTIADAVVPIDPTNQPTTLEGYGPQDYGGL